MSFHSKELPLPASERTLFNPSYLGHRGHDQAESEGDLDERGVRPDRHHRAAPDQDQEQGAQELPDEAAPYVAVVRYVGDADHCVDAWNEGLEVLGNVGL